jgi:hypothetical protein
MLHNFQDTSSYLPIFNAVLLTDMSVIILSIVGAIQSKVLKDWYASYNLSAVISDVFIIVLCLILARFMYPFVFGNEFSLLKFTGLSVTIQVIHDTLFYYLFNSIPKGTNRMLDTFKSYASEVKLGAILSDSAMVIASCILAYSFSSLSFNTNIIMLIGLIYMLPYLIYSR